MPASCSQVQRSPSGMSYAISSIQSYSAEMADAILIRCSSLILLHLSRCDHLQAVLLQMKGCMSLPSCLWHSYRLHRCMQDHGRIPQSLQPPCA